MNSPVRDANSPARDVSPSTTLRPIVVAKFGGSSLATPEHIRAIADRIASEREDGSDRVVVVSAMGDTTDDLLGLATRVSRRPDPRELDLLLATGEHISAALLVMAGLAILGAGSAALWIDWRGWCGRGWLLVVGGVAGMSAGLWLLDPRESGTD